jgi:hypothetical protein
MTSSTLGNNISAATEVTHISSHGLWLLTQGKELFLAYEDFPWFKSQTVEAIIHVQELSPNHLYWPDMDIDLSIESIENPKRFPLVAKQH